MLVKPESIGKIKDYFGLNIYETKVWLALLSKGIASAGDVAKVSRVPRSRTYDILESLEKKGFAIAKLEKPIKYLGVKPAIILERLKSDVRKEAEEKIDFLANIRQKEEFSELEKMYKESVEPIAKKDPFLSLRDKVTISNFIKSLLEKAKKEVLVCTDVEDINSKIKLFKKTIAELKKSGVVLKIALSGKSEEIQQVSEALGIKIKETQINAKFFIIDRSEMLFYLSKNPGEENAVWVGSEFFAKAFSELIGTGIKFD